MEALAILYENRLFSVLMAYFTKIINPIKKVLSSSVSLTKKIILHMDDDYNTSVKETGATSETRIIAGKMLDNYGDIILRVAYSYLHNMSDAEDILQDTLIQVLKSNPVFENAAHEKAWLIRVATNLSKNKINYNKLRDTDELNDELVADGREDLSFIWEAVKQLPERFREVIHLFYQEGYSTKDIADILNRNESTVRSDLKRGRDQLKLVLKEAYDFE